MVAARKFAIANKEKSFATNVKFLLVTIGRKSVSKIIEKKRILCGLFSLRSDKIFSAPKVDRILHPSELGDVNDNERKRPRCGC